MNGMKNVSGIDGLGSTPGLCRLFVLDDQVMLLDAIERILADDPAIELVGTASEATEAISAMTTLCPDAVMLDIDLGGELSGFDVLRVLKSPTANFGVPARPRVVVTSMFDNPMYRNRAFELGADAYASKGLRFATVRALLLDDLDYKPPETDQGRFWRNSSEVLSGAIRSPLLTLSARERAVVRGVASGRLEKEIADSLGVSVSSVNTFLRRAMTKLKVQTRAELLRLRHAIN